ncbi:MAG: thiamine diphosphokinase [Brockia lithotrophica]|nr:thiamine diphosphokinase [Brockia lithotrophica]
MRAVFVVAGGAKEEGDFRSLLRAEGEETEGVVLIGADEGALWLVEHGFRPELAVGDFDTVGDEGIRRLLAAGVSVRTFAREKDATDTDLAVEAAREFRPDVLVVYGGIGTRFDHTLANVHILYRLVRSGCRAYLADPHNRIRLLGPGIHALRSTFPFVSLLPWSEEVRGITLQGFRFPLENASLAWGTSRGISNELLALEGEIRIREGYLLVVESRDTA